ncbi:MAG: histidinol-phosphatase [Candidatus Omnitrophica bacterium]|nr:histidinol-phosphatase [Candidatus Omnitrophota bacterium]
MARRVLFIDRDGTLIVEPPDEQVDSLEKLKVLPEAVEGLSAIAKRGGFELVIVTNQDGLGTDSFPEEKFLPAHNKMLETFQKAGVEFKEVLIDRSMPHENAPTRKPRTGLLKGYMTPLYDLKHSFVIGDRLTDVELARNLGTKAILLKGKPGQTAATVIKEKGLEETIALIASDWKQIVEFLKDQVEKQETWDWDKK